MTALTSMALALLLSKIRVLVFEVTIFFRNPPNKDVKNGYLIR